MKLNTNNKKQVGKKISWEKTPAYREAVLLKVLRAMKSYGYSKWMEDELKLLGISL